MMAKQIGRFCARMTEEMTIKTIFSTLLLCIILFIDTVH